MTKHYLLARMSHLKQSLSSLLLIPLMCACSPGGLAAPKQTSNNVVASTPIQETKIVSETHASLPPARDGGEVLQRLLSLIDSLHQPQDLTPENVTRFTGVALRDSSWSGHLHYDGNASITEKWFSLYAYGVDDETHQPSFNFSFHETEQDSGIPTPMTGICQLDMDKFHAALLKMGFRHYGNTRQNTPARQYQRNLLTLDIGYMGESEEHVEHDCVARVYGRFLETYIDFGELK